MIGNLNFGAIGNFFRFLENGGQFQPQGQQSSPPMQGGNVMAQNSQAGSSMNWGRLAQNIGSVMQATGAGMQGQDTSGILNQMRSRNRLWEQQDLFDQKTEGLWDKFKFPSRSSETFIPSRHYQPSRNPFNMSSDMTGGNLHSKAMMRRFSLPNSNVSSSNPYIRNIYY